VDVLTARIEALAAVLPERGGSDDQTWTGFLRQQWWVCHCWYTG